MRFDDDTPETGSSPAFFPRNPPTNLIRDMDLLHPRNFFTFEGYDGCGKSTLVKEVTKVCAAREVSVATFKLAGSELLRHAMERAKWLNVDPICFNLLNWVSLFHQTNEITDVYNTSRLIFFDRYTISVRTRGALEGLSTAYMDILEPMIPQPTTIFMIDCDPEVSVQRIRKHQRAVTYFETGTRHVSSTHAPMVERGVWERRPHETTDKQLIQIFCRMRDRYAEVARSYPRVKLIDNSGSLSDSVDSVLIHLPALSTVA